MAIDRTTKYRCQWQSKAGWAMMLEIIPAGEYMDLTAFDVVNFRRAAMSYEFAGAGFDDLPIGMMKHLACSFEFKFQNLPSGLKELLKTPEFDGTEGSYETTTLFTLWSDEGLGGDLIIQYVGAQAKTLGNKFTLSSIDSVDSVKIETFDLIKTILDVLPSNMVFGDVGGNEYWTQTTETVNRSGVTDFIYINGATFPIKSDSFSSNRYMMFYSISQFRTYLIFFFEKFLAIWTRTGTIGSTYEQSVYTNNYPSRAVTLYKQGTTQVHTKGTALNEDTVLILGHVCDYDGTNYTSLGGFFSNDKEGVSEYDSESSFLTALCENLTVKFRWKPITETNGVTGFTNINYVFHWLKPLESSVTTISLTPKIIGKNYDISTAEKVFLVAESETPNMGQDNTALNRVSLTVSNKTDVWSTKFILHNSPTIPTDSGGFATVQIENRVYPRKLYYVESGAVYKVHESVVISDGINTKTLDNPTALPNDNNWNIDTVSGWVTETQQTAGMQQATAEYITENWGKRDQCIREFTCKMIGGDAAGSIMPRHAGDVFTLPTVDELGATATSVLLEAKPDYESGTIECKFLSLGA